MARPLQISEFLPDHEVDGKPSVALYDAAVFTLPAFQPQNLAGPRPVFIPPAIDPLTAKNCALPAHWCRREVAGFGLDLARPVIIQVSRFDPWKDPLGVIQAYKLVVSEALWKGRPVAAGNTGGIPLQIEDGESGLLTGSPKDCADKIIYLLENPARAETMGERGRERVRRNFLITRLLRDELRLIQALLAA